MMLSIYTTLSACSVSVEHEHTIVGRIKCHVVFVVFAGCHMGSRLTVVSREAKKKQHACASSGPRDHYSELFTRMAALKF